MEQPLLPSFRAPPVIETALSIQFDGLEGFTNAHLGLFWATLREQYPLCSDAEPIPTQREVFGDSATKIIGPPRVRFGKDPSARLQMASADKHRMIQVQNGRIVYNWRRLEGGEYPRWSKVRPFLNSTWTEYLEFLSSQGLVQPKPNQWEVVYVNHLVKGVDWHSPKDWPDLIPGLIGAQNRIVGGSPESFSGNWHVTLDKSIGRLHIDLFHAFSAIGGKEKDPQEMLVLHLTARGPVSEDITAGLELGHREIVLNFTAITGEKAHERWGRER